MISKKKEEFEKEKKMKKKNENDINNNGETQEDKKTESSSNHNSNNIKEEYVNNVNIKKLDRNKTMVIKYMKTLEKKKETIIRKRLEPEFTSYNFKGKEKDPTDIQ